MVGALATRLAAGVCRLFIHMLSGVDGQRRRVQRGALCAAVVLALAGCAGKTVVATAPVDDGAAVYVTDTDVLTAYRVRDSSVRWTYPAPSGSYFFGGPTYFAGLVVVEALNNRDASSMVIAVRAIDGRQAWRLQLPDPSPVYAVGGNYVVVEIEGATLDGHALLVVRAVDGTQVSEFPLRGGYGNFAVDGDVAFNCPADGTLDAYRLSDGFLLWHMPAALSTLHPDAVGAATGQPGCLPEASDGTVYASTGTDSGYADVSPGTLAAMRERDGQVLWRYRGSVGRTPLACDGTVYLYAATTSAVVGQPPTYTVVALRAQDGAPLWQIPRTSGGGQVITRAGSAVIFSQGNDLRAVNAGDGTTLWQYHESQREVAPLGATSGVVFAVSDYSPNHKPIPFGADTSPYLVALRASDGSLFWRTPLRADAQFAIPRAPGC